ncbi:MAG: S-methyl-5-thioribose-1-phosphate isomerase [Chlorobi bacterium]|nr:S-methyl-5-thioribose-1-phosphate isomerase [Chlorobiota bacterium]
MITAFDWNDVLRWSKGAVRFLDQARLPFEVIVHETTDYRRIVDAIKRLEIRGAPLIGIAAGYGMALAAKKFSGPNFGKDDLEKAFRAFASSRPTAVNLFWVLERVRKLLDQSPTGEIPARMLDLALRVHEDDRKRCKAIGRHGLPLVGEGGIILTHCNTGALAAAGGTALSVVFLAHEQDIPVEVFVDETRPLLQGARLTVWELRQRGIPHRLIVDGAAPHVMRTFPVTAVITGADRIARNGDAANKIGTYMLATAARRHGIPFYIAAPLSTVDARIEKGDQIPIEERGSEEITSVLDRPVTLPDTPVFAPAFDVTPNELITAIITDAGVLYPPFSSSIPEALERGGDMTAEQE